MADRERLPDRRPSANHMVIWQTDVAHHKFDVTVGYHPATGRISEVFYATGMKEGTDLLNAAQDSCVLISLLLQTGHGPAEIGKSLSATRGGRPASIIGAIVAALPEMEVAG